MPEIRSYKLVDMFGGLGTFVKISKPVKVRENQVLNFGANHITFDKFDNKQIEIRFVEGSRRNDTFIFYPESKTKIKIGRGATSDI